MLFKALCKGSCVLESITKIKAAYPNSKILRIMRLTAIFLLAAAIHVSARGFSQEVTLSLRKVPIQKVFTEIIRQTGVSIVYSESMFERSPKVSVEVKNAPVAEVLEKCFQGQLFEYAIEGQMIVIKKKSISLLYEQTTEQKLREDVSGTVKDKEGKPLAGATVSVKGTSIAATTDDKGNFRIKAQNGAVLVVSYIGFQTKEIVVSGENSVSINLAPENSSLNDVIIVGYGSQTRRHTTGSISKISSKEFEQSVVSTVDQALQGRAAGVQVVNSSGEPGASVVVKIRGTNSLSGNNQPLYVVDGFPMPSFQEASAPNLSGTYSSNGLFGLNPSDIESIEILKDAAATAIYGSRGANGVVLITTKKGQSGHGVIEVINKTALSTVSNPYLMMNAYEYATVKNQTFLGVNQTAPFNLDSIPATGNTNWLDVISRTGLRQENGISYRGGSGKTNYFISGNYLADLGVIKSSDNKRGSIRFNLNTELKPWYNIKLQTSATRARLTRAITETKVWPWQAGPLFDALRAGPLHKNNNEITELQDVYNGVSLAGYAFINPLNELTDKTDFTFNDLILANIENIFSLDKKKNFQLHLIFGSGLQNSQRQINLPPWLGSARTYNGIASQSSAKTQSFYSTTYLSYNLTHKRHRLNSTAGVEYTNEILDQFDATGRGITFSSVSLYALQSAKTQSINSYKEESVIRSGFIRENYSFDDKYLLSVSLRADGASKFAQNKKWAYFPSLAVAWNIDKEQFFQDLKNVDYAKLRASYGFTGSQSLPAYRASRRYTAGLYQTGNTPGGANPSSTLFVTQPNNPDLKWETTKQFDAGLDLSVFNSSVTLALDYYRKTTVDLLQAKPIPSQSGYSSIWANSGSIQNRGVEVNLGINLISRKQLSWSTNFIYTKNKTVLIDLGKFDPKSQGISSLGGNLLSGNATIMIPGEALGQFYGYKVIGLYQKSDFDGAGHALVPVPQNTIDNYEGRFKFLDLNKSGTINDSDKVVIGNAQPKFVLGWNNNIRWKQWNLNLFFYSSFGNKILNVSGAYLRSGILNFAGVAFNQTKDWYEKRYTSENPTNDPWYPAVQPVPTGGALAYSDAMSNMIEDGTFVRLKSATLSFAPKLKSKTFQMLNIYLTATNILTFTNYSGFDPEVSSYGTDIRLQGIDFAAYPNYKSYALGITIQL